MTAHTKNSFRPALEALEDRFMPSTTPLTMLNPPMLNAMSGYMNFISQQAEAAMTAHAHTLSHQAVQASGIKVFMTQEHIHHLWMTGKEIIGMVEVDSKYLDGDKLKGNLHFEAGYHWASDKDPSFHSQTIQLRPFGGGRFYIEADSSIFQGHVGYSTLEGRVEIYQGRTKLDGGQHAGNWYVLRNYAPNENQNGGFSANPSQTESLNADNHPGSVAEMSARDQFFVALGQSSHYNAGSHSLTAADWAV